MYHILYHNGARKGIGYYKEDMVSDVKEDVKHFALFQDEIYFIQLLCA